MRVQVMGSCYLREEVEFGGLARSLINMSMSVLHLTKRLGLVVWRSELDIFWKLQIPSFSYNKAMEIGPSNRSDQESKFDFCPQMSWEN